MDIVWKVIVGLIAAALFGAMHYRNVYANSVWGMRKKEEPTPKAKDA